jgi:NAD(P)-dependent dehydrogenase (short-subunit alcohol dehydrogenase family)
LARRRKTRSRWRGDGRGRGEERGEAVRPRRKDRRQRGRTLSVSCDVTDEGQAHALIRHSEEEFGRVDILVNNAGGILLSKVEKGLSNQ